MVMLVVLQGSQCWHLQVRSATFVGVLGFVHTEREREREREIVREIGRVHGGERERRKVFGFVWFSHNHVTHTLTIVLVGYNYGYFNPN